MDSQTDERFDLALRMAILESRLTQRQVAKLTRIEYTRLSKLVHRQAVPFPKEIKRLAKALGRKPFELFPPSTLGTLLSEWGDSAADRRSFIVALEANP